MSGVEQRSCWAIFILITATVLLLIRLLRFTASWSWAAVVFIISIAFGLGDFSGRFPIRNDPTVLHPLMLLPFFQLAWLAIAIVLVAKHSTGHDAENPGWVKLFEGFMYNAETACEQLSYRRFL